MVNRCCLTGCMPCQVEANIEDLLARQQQLQEQREQLFRTITVNSRAPKADWQGTFAWDNEVHHLLHTSFALDSFRSCFCPILFSCIHKTMHNVARLMHHADMYCPDKGAF